MRFNLNIQQRSPQRCENVKKKILDLPQNELIQDVVTRWNSTQLMIERLVEQRRVITGVMLDNSVTKKADVYMLLKDNEWDSLSELSDVLGKLTKVNTYMSSDSVVLTTVIYPIVCGLLKTISQYLMTILVL